MPQKVALGKGLGALINQRVASPTPMAELGEHIQRIKLDDIKPTPLQPRTEFHGERLKELIDSIREHGIIQPLIVRQRLDKYELIAGERRWRAAREVGLIDAPVIVRDASDQEVLELALIENLQREDLNPIEEALAFSRLAREFGLRQEDIAQKVGKSRAAVANCMRLLELHPEIQSWLAHDRISVGHAKVLLSLKTHDEQFLIADMVVRQGRTVRATEKLVADHFANKGATRPTRSAGDGARQAQLEPQYQNVQNRLQERLTTRVVLHPGEKRGRIEIEYYGKDDLQRIIELLGVGPE